MGSIIAIANQKGGVGKTTVAVHLGHYLGRAGRKVALIDGDPQGNATSWMLDGDLSRNGFPRLLISGEPIADVIVPVERWAMYLLPGNHTTGKVLGYVGTTPTESFDAIANAIRPLARTADYVLIDMPPSRAAGFQELLFAADWILVPTQLERLSLEGVTFMAEAVQELSDKHGRGPRLLGVVPNMVRQVKEHREQLASLTETFKELVWPGIPQSVRASEACGYGVSLFDQAPNEVVTQALAKMAQHFLEKMEAEHAKP